MVASFVMTKISFKLSPKLLKAEKKQDLFQSKLDGWLKELTPGWKGVKAWLKKLMRTLENATAKINLCFIRLMLKRFALAEDGEGSYIA